MSRVIPISMFQQMISDAMTVYEAAAQKNALKVEAGNILSTVENVLRETTLVFVQEDELLFETPQRTDKPLKDLLDEFINLQHARIALTEALFELVLKMIHAEDLIEAEKIREVLSQLGLAKESKEVQEAIGQKQMEVNKRQLFEQQLEEYEEVKASLAQNLAKNDLESASAELVKLLQSIEKFDIPGKDYDTYEQEVDQLADGLIKKTRLLAEEQIQNKQFESALITVKKITGAQVCKLVNSYIQDYSDFIQQQLRLDKYNSAQASMLKGLSENNLERASARLVELIQIIKTLNIPGKNHGVYEQEIDKLADGLIKKTRLLAEEQIQNKQFESALATVKKITEAQNHTLVNSFIRDFTDFVQQQQKLDKYNFVQDSMIENIVKNNLERAGAQLAELMQIVKILNVSDKDLRTYEKEVDQMADGLIKKTRSLAEEYVRNKQLESALATVKKITVAQDHILVNSFICDFSDFIQQQQSLSKYRTLRAGMIQSLSENDLERASVELAELMQIVKILNVSDKDLRTYEKEIDQLADGLIKKTGVLAGKQTQSKQFESALMTVRKISIAQNHTLVNSFVHDFSGFIHQQDKLDKYMEAHTGMVQSLSKNDLSSASAKLAELMYHAEILKMPGNDLRKYEREIDLLADELIKKTSALVEENIQNKRLESALSIISQLTLAKNNKLVASYIFEFSKFIQQQQMVEQKNAETKYISTVVWSFLIAIGLCTVIIVLLVRLW